MPLLIHGTFQSVSSLPLKGLLGSWVEVDAEDGRFSPVISDLILAKLCQERWNLCETISNI